MVGSGEDGAQSWVRRWLKRERRGGGGLTDLNTNTQVHLILEWWLVGCS